MRNGLCIGYIVLGIIGVTTIETCSNVKDIKKTLELQAPSAQRIEANVLGDPNIPETFDVQGNDTTFVTIDGMRARDWYVTGMNRKYSSESR